MNHSPLRTRRGIVAAVMAAALSRVLPQPVRAQLNGNCEYGITNGLVTIGGADCELGVPQHMIDATNNTLDGDDGIIGSTTQSPKDIRLERLQRKRDHKRTKRGRQTTQKQEKQDRQREQKILCEDFSSQREAVEAMAQSSWATKRLDPNGDGLPCENLRALTCSEFRDEAEATNWFNRMGYSPAFDPFKLYDAETNGVCTVRGICNKFSNQKAAVEWLTDHPKDKNRLDPDGNGAPCADLPTVTCKSFSNQNEATNWFNHNNFTKNKDPYQLYDAETNSICPTKVTCATFKDQKAAVEWMDQNGDPQNRLDPDDDGRPCTNLEPITCSQLAKEEGSAENVTAWYYLYFTDAVDPYKLRGKDKDNKDVVCPAKG